MRPIISKLSFCQKKKFDWSKSWQYWPEIRHFVLTDSRHLHCLRYVFPLFLESPKVGWVTIWVLLGLVRVSLVLVGCEFGFSSWFRVSRFSGKPVFNFRLYCVIGMTTSDYIGFVMQRTG